MTRSASRPMQAPIPSVTTLQDIMYTVTGLEDAGKTIQRGPNKGKNKYWNTLENTLIPGWRDLERRKNMDTEDAVFKIFE